MRKYNEGYALPFAVVVMLVLCLVAVSILTFSLQNLQNQQNSIERMQDKYEAQGEVEKKIANVESIGSTSYSNLQEAKNAIEDILGDGTVSWTGDNYSCSFSQTVQSGFAEISYTIMLNNVIAQDGNGYSIKKPTITYNSYKISYVEATIPIAAGEDTP